MAFFMASASSDFLSIQSGVALILVGVSLLLFVLRNFNSWFYEPKHRQGQAPLPPGDLGWPMVGNMSNFLRAFKYGNPEDFIGSYVHKYGRTGIYKAFLFWQPTILVTTPETCRPVYMNDECFSPGWPNSAIRLMGKNSFIGIPYEEHKRLRKLTEPILHSPNMLKTYFPRISARFEISARNWAEQGQIILFKEIKKFTYYVISDILTGQCVEAEIDQVAKNFAVMNGGIRAMPINLPGTAFNTALQARKYLVNFFQKIVTKRRKASEQNSQDVLGKLLTAVDDSGKMLEDEQIIDLLIMFFNAGHDSSAHLTMWVIILLQQHPEVCTKVKEEQQRIMEVKMTGEPLNFEDMKMMPYLSMVINETLRIVSISPMGFRKALKDIEVNGYRIPKDWHVETWARNVNMDPVNYPNPNKFDPDRWVDMKPRPCSFLPFGAGNRLCPGQELTKIEATIVVHHLLLYYEIEAVNPNFRIVYLPHPRPNDFYPMKVRKI